MTTPLRRRIRHTRRWLGYSVLMLLIAVALLVAVASQLLPLVERHPDQIATWLGERVGQQIHFTGARGEWTRRGPRFTLDGLQIGQGDRTVQIGSAELLVAVYSGLLPGEPLTELKVHGLPLVLEQLPDSRWQVLGLPQPKTPVIDPLESLQGFGELQVEQASLRVRAPARKLDVYLPRVDLRLRVSGSRVRGGLNVWAVRGGSPMQVVVDLNRGRYDGMLWAGGEKLNMPEWSSLLAVSGVQFKQGRGDVDVWARLRQQRVDQVQLRTDLRDVDLESMDWLAPLDAVKTHGQTRHDRVRAQASWRVEPQGWQLEAPLLRFEDGEKIARLDGFRMRGGDAIEVRAPYLDLTSAASLFTLSDHLPAGLRTWLLQGNPGAILRNLHVSGRRQGRWHASARVENFSLQPAGQRPGIHGLSGWLAMDDRGGVLRITNSDAEGRHATVFEWPAGLRQNLEVSVHGSVAWWRAEQGRGWTIATPDLQIRGDGFAARVRAQLGIQDDGSAPILDLAAQLEPTSFSSAKKFWIMHKMPLATVKWLDEALVEGQVVNGRIVIAGDLDDWPFRHGEGRFEARADIRGATVRFSPEWPVGKQLNAALVFNGPGFEVDGQALLAGNTIGSLTGGIADFHAPWLDLAIQAQGKGEKLRALMIASPLNKTYGEHLKAVSIKGDADVELELLLPLGHDLGEQKISGSLQLRDAQLADSRWDIAYTGVSGLTRFTEKGFATENLAVQFEQHPGVFNLRVGAPFTGDPNLAALVTMQGRLPPQALIRRYAGVQWLSPFLRGSSDWSVAVRIPLTPPGGEAAPSQLQLSSNLLGTDITLPAPLRKPAASAITFELSSPLPIEKGEMSLRLGNTMRLRGRMRTDAPMDGILQFGEGALAPIPAQGLVVRGNVVELDAAGWIAFSAGAEGASALRSVDVQASNLMFFDYPFANSRLQLDRGPVTTRIQVAGAGIEGAVDVPNDPAAGVLGRFGKLHFVAAGVPATPAVQTETSPLEVPPLRFTIDDLRLGQAQLGKAELQTSQVSNGMRVDRFKTLSKTAGINATGEWLQAENGSRSNFQVEFTADSLGKMMDAFGFAGMVQGGKTKATLTGSWPGSPGAFSLATLSGSLKAEVGEGRLLDVEPGGSGRILGLISLAEIPRRLSLDFSDFFSKGFSFNTMNGDFVFNNGFARTDNLRINGPAADIRVSGSTGLRDQTYDQRVEVLPKAGSILPAIGMLAGGPAGAAVGAVAQAVLQRPLKQTARVVYRISGPWKKPVVEVIEKGPANAAPAPPKPLKPNGR